MNENKTSTQKAVEALSEHANSFSTKHKDFSKGIRSEHRTVQQSIMNSIIVLINDWSSDYDNGHYDDRNEATVTLAKKLNAITKDVHLQMI